jgi:hypothetical protein
MDLMEMNLSRHSISSRDKKAQPRRLGFGVVALGARSANRGGRSRGLQQFPHAPDVIGDASGHSRDYAKRLVDAAKVVEREPARNSGPVVLPLLAEGVRQPSESAKSHARAQIVALNDGCADALRIGLPHDWDYLDGSNLGGRVPRFAFAGGPVDFDELREAGEPIMQRVRDRGSVGRESRPW